MKKNLLIFSCIILTCIANTNAQRKCATMEYLAAQKAKNTSIERQMQEVERNTAAYIANQRLGNNFSNASTPIVTIPVVFHIVYKTSTQNISDARCIAQINQLNLDYAKLNSDTNTVPAVFRGVAADTKIQFCLAQRDPSGNTTTGIIRKTTTSTSFSTDDKVKAASTGGDDAWPSASYLNIWVCNLSGGVLGYAQFPGGGSTSTDGVVLLYSSVGSMSSPAPNSGAPYNLGRTATHEVGHWLNLRHIWGDANCGNDLVGDTPTQQDANYSCPTYPQVTCSNGPNGDMFMNYMDYVDDRCMQMFTAGQVTRMNALFSNTGTRKSLLTSLGCQSSVNTNFIFNSSTAATITCGASNSATVSLGTTAATGFTTPIVLTAAGNPAGTSISFSPSSLTPGNSSNVVLNNINTLAPGTYNVTITGTAGAVVKTTTVSYVVNAGANPIITNQPINDSICAGGTASFTVSSSSAGISYQWMVSTNGGTTFNNVPTGGTSSTLNIANVSSTMNNYKYKVNIYTQCGSVFSNVVNLYATSTPTISTDLSTTLTVCENSNRTISVTATGGQLIYQWQVSRDNGVNFTNTGTNSNSLLVSNITLDSTNSYRVIVAGYCPGKDTSRTCKLNVVSSPVISSQTNHDTICSSSPVSLTASGGNSYTWTSTSFSGSKTGSSIVVNPTTTVSITDISYIVVGTNANNCSSSDTIKITVNPLPQVSLSPNVAYATLIPGRNIVLNASVIPSSGFDYIWLKDGNLIPNANTNQYTINGGGNEPFNQYLGNYSFIAINASTGCSDTSMSIIIRDSVVEKLFIFPNPTSSEGNFTVSYYNNSDLNVKQSISIFESHGAKVYQQTNNVVKGYNVFKINASKFSTGSYFVVLRDQNGNQIAVGNLFVAH